MSPHKENQPLTFTAHINPNESYELQFWSKRFHVTQDTLKNAVQKVGTSTADIEQFLKKQYFLRG
ncbi:MAG: DUF3606 domain-containing protein [Bacteroidia bacterium]